MRSRLVGAVTTAAISSLILGVNLMTSPLASAATPQAAAVSQSVAPQAQARAMPAGIDPGVGHYVASCPPVAAGSARCFAMRRTDIPAQHFTVNPDVTPQGYGPADIRSAYNLPSLTAGVGETIAVVDAYGDPTAESDLAVYRAQYGLPPCTTANGCFKKVSQTGGTNYPAKNNSWGTEDALDLDAISATCPNCHIILVEATTQNGNNLYISVNEAATFHPTVISNSWGSSEFSGETSYDATYFNHPGIAIVASSGDSGYGVQYPAASPDVTAVGGTSLTTNTSSRGWGETVWNNSIGAPGSGCSKYEPKPSWQKDTGCANRTVADVSAVADPDTGLAIYDTTGDTGWDVYGGTSLSAPIISSVYALENSISATGPVPASYPYSHTSALNDVTAGNDGSCSSSYLCTAKVGYDGPTGLGTPSGDSAFSSGSSTGSNDFAISDSPASSSVTAGGSTTSTVSTTVTSGSAQTVALTTSGAPAGVTVSLSPTSVTAGGSSTLTATTTSAAAAGTYPITVTGTSSAAAHSATYTLTVTKPVANDFSISDSPASASVAAGGSAASTISTTIVSGTAQTVALTTSGAPAGVTVSLSPTSVTTGGSSTLTATTTSAAAAGTYPITVTGTSSAAAHSATYTLTVTSTSSGPTSYQAESSTNTLAGGAIVIACAPCSGGARVGDIGAGGTLTFNNITVPTAGTYQVVVTGSQDQGSTLTAYISVNGGTAVKVVFARTASWSTDESVTVPMTLNAGTNTIGFSNPTKNCPDIDVITVP